MVAQHEFMFGKGLHQGDLLSPFLFLIATKGLNSLRKQMVDKDLFKGVKLRALLTQVSHLQFVDYTIIMGHKVWQNILAMKFVFLLF